MNKENWLKRGYVDEPVAQGLDLKAEIRKLCKGKTRCQSWGTTTSRTKFRK